MMQTELEKFYSEAYRVAKSHYENFPVISLFLPAYLRKHVAVIYQFARTADDIADEGDAMQEDRISRLEEFQSEFNSALVGKYKNMFWRALANTIDTFQLSPDNFQNLLKAFKHDVCVNRYETFEDVLIYCQKSANPVGRLILELHGIKDQFANQFSDNICSALQLTNFYQDLSIDIKMNRIYVSLNDLSRFSVKEENFFEKNFTPEFKELMKFQVERVRGLFREGRKLLPFLPAKLRIQIKWTILGGEKILTKIEKLDYNVIMTRPKLNKPDYFILMLKALF